MIDKLKKLIFYEDTLIYSGRGDSHIKWTGVFVFPFRAEKAVSVPLFRTLCPESSTAGDFALALRILREEEKLCQ